MKIENRQQVLSALAIAVVGLLLLDRLVITPLISGWKDRQKLIGDLNTDILKGRSIVERGPLIRERWENMRTNTLAVETAERKLLEAFQRWSDNSRISISSIQPQLKTEDDHATLECRAVASGSVNALAQFIYQMETDPMALHVESLEITSRDENGRNLSLALQVSGLILTVPEE